MIPGLRDVLVNPQGFPSSPPTLRLTDRGDFTDILYAVDEVVSDWDAYSEHLARNTPAAGPRVLLVSHDMSEIENITLMALGGVVRHLLGQTRYLLVNPRNVEKIDEAIEDFHPDWIGFSLYTGLTDHVFEWLRRYKIDRARQVIHRNFEGLEQADNALKLVQESQKWGPLREGARVVYAPVIVGGQYNNHDYRTSWDRGADYSIRGKGINLFKDILQGRFPPGIYHDPVSYPNLPRFDREGFYRDTFAFSDETKKYALSPIKSVLTALGCAYRCTYCYIGSLIENQAASYADTGVRPPSIIQDRPLDIVLAEGLDILELDEVYRVKTTAVFDQADISLNNLSWWEQLRPRWVEQVGIPFYIQARPAMLAGNSGRERIASIAKDRLVAGISMAIESGDPAVRRLLLKRLETNEIVLDALKNVKSFRIPVRTQAITGLPVVRPRRPVDREIGLVEADGREHYYADPLQETLLCLDLVASSGHFATEDYYWNALYSPFPGTPLGDYSLRAGLHDGGTDGKEKAYMLTSEVGLTCFEPDVVRRQVTFHRTANFFAHLLNGREMMERYLYRAVTFSLEDFSRFVADHHQDFVWKAGYNKFGLIASPSRGLLADFLAYAYPDPADEEFRVLNHRLMPYFEILLDGLLLAAKIAVRYFEQRVAGKDFDLDQLSRVERDHYYDNNYCMTYVPDRFAEFLLPLVHENRQGVR